MNYKKTLARIFVLALVFRIIFAFINPMFQQPDEKAHFEYIDYIASTGRLPVQGHFYSEFFQPPFFYFIAAFALKFAKIFTHDTWHLVLAMRHFSILIGMITIFVTYKTASILFKNKNIALGAAAFAAFLPSNISSSANITNANLADLLATLIIYMLIVILARAEDYKKIILLGIAAGISLLTRLSTIPAVMAIGFTFILKYYRNPKKIFKPVILIIIISLLLSGWVFFRNFTLYNDFLGYNAMKLSTPPDNREHNLLFAARLVGWTFVTFWAAFGRTNGIFIGNFDSTAGIAIFAAAYSLLLLFSLMAIFGLYIHFRKKNALGSLQKKSFVIFAVHLLLLIFTFISFNLYNFQPQGRYFYPAISTIAIIFTFGIYNFLNSIKKEIFLRMYLILFVLLDLFSIISIIYYYK